MASLSVFLASVNPATSENRKHPLLIIVSSIANLRLQKKKCERIMSVKYYLTIRLLALNFYEVIVNYRNRERVI